MITLYDKIELRLVGLFGDSPTEDSIYNDIYDEWETGCNHNSWDFQNFIQASIRNAIFVNQNKLAMMVANAYKRFNENEAYIASQF